MTQYILSLDRGTTRSRAMLFTGDGQIVGPAQHEFAQHFPKTGWIEHDPIDVLRTQLAAAVEALAGAGIRPAKSRPSGSRISVKPRSCGTGRPGRRFTT
jgi:glycerol kinase